MFYSRRRFAWLLPAFAGGARAAEKLTTSKAWRFEDLPVRVNGDNSSRAVFDLLTHSGFAIDAHYTELAPGKMPHAAHRHVHEELLIVREGTLEMTASGRQTRIGPGSVAFLASNEEHGWRNVGDTRALYLVLALGREK